MDKHSKKLKRQRKLLNRQRVKEDRLPSFIRKAHDNQLVHRELLHGFQRNAYDNLSIKVVFKSLWNNELTNKMLKSSKSRTLFRKELSKCLNEEVFKQHAAILPYFIPIFHVDASGNIFHKIYFMKHNHININDKQTTIWADKTCIDVKKISVVDNGVCTIKHYDQKQTFNIWWTTHAIDRAKERLNISQNKAIDTFCWLNLLGVSPYLQFSFNKFVNPNTTSDTFLTISAPLSNGSEIKYEPFLMLPCLVTTIEDRQSVVILTTLLPGMSGTPKSNDVNIEEVVNIIRNYWNDAPQIIG